MSRYFNFSAGPGVLPLEVLKKAQAELVEYRTAGMSVMEMSHRSKDYMAIIEGTEKNLRELMSIPDNYKVLFLQGGASLQFAMVPMNLFSASNPFSFIFLSAQSRYVFERSTVTTSPAPPAAAYTEKEPV